jgi:hypothetical protein
METITHEEREKRIAEAYSRYYDDEDECCWSEFILSDAYKSIPSASDHIVGPNKMIDESDLVSAKNEHTEDIKPGCDNCTFHYRNGKACDCPDKCKLGSCWELRPVNGGWISVKDRLPENYSLGMSRDVLTLAGTKQSVKCYDYALKRWNGSPFVTVTYWMELPELPKS